MQNIQGLERILKTEERLEVFPSHLIGFHQLSGVPGDLAQTFPIASKKNTKDYDALISRLKALPKAIDQQILLLKQGVKQGVTSPQVVLRNVPKQLLNQMPKDVMKSHFLKPFQKFPRDFTKEQKEKYLNQAVTIFQSQIRPKIQELEKYLVSEYIPNARKSIALGGLPQGKAWYQARVASYTTTNLTPDEIHNIGLKEVARIRGEMKKILQQVKFKGDLQAFFEHLRTHPKFYFDKREDLLKEYRDIAKRADAKLVRVFGVLPRLPYGIEPIPAYAEKSMPTAYYMQGSMELGRPGVFYANTYDLKTRPKWEMEALTLHEAVPGHHFQISIAKELKGLPRFRQEAGFTAFIEGWGLYSESLGEEMGFYQDPYSKFGQLTYEMWRAIRLVVDTGMHAKGWSRDRAIQFFKDNAGKSEHDIVVEVDRYIVWPGQALSYKIGQLKIWELRRKAKAELKDKFDLRLFHDEVLGAGPLPLDILQRRIEAWIQKQKTS